MNLFRASALVVLLAVSSIAFAQCCPGDGVGPADGKCPAVQGEPVVLTTADILQQAIRATDLAGKAVSTQFAELTKLGEKVMSQEGLDEEKLAPLQEKYFKTVSLIRYAQNIVGFAKFESEFIEDDGEYLEATRQVLKAQKALSRAQVLTDELQEALTALAPKDAEDAEVPVPVEDEAGANDG